MPTKTKPLSKRPGWPSTRRSATNGRSFGIPSGLSSCSRCRTSTEPAAFSSPGSGHRLVACVPWREWIRTVEIEPSIYAADFSRLGEQIEVLLRAGARVFHFDVGDGHFVPPVTIGPIVLKWIAPLIHEYDGKVDCHLMVDDPAKHIPEIAQAGGDSVTFHYEAVDEPSTVSALAREHGLQVGLAFNPESEP